MKNYFILMSVLIPSITSANQAISPDQVIWGMYCGECIENCSTMRKIEHSALSIDTSDKFFESAPFNYVFSGKRAPDNEFKQYQWLLHDQLPLIISKEQSIFGQPDAYDQCGYYLEYRVNHKKFKMLIDPDKIPDELKVIVRKLFHESQ